MDRRIEAIEDLALYLRKWAKEESLPLGEGIQDVITAIFVASQGSPAAEHLANAIQQAAWSIVHQRKEAYSPGTIAQMTRNVNDILRGRA